MLEQMLDRTLPMYVVIAFFLSLTYHQLSILLFAQALTREHWIWKISSLLRQLSIVTLNAPYGDASAKEPISMDSYEPEEVILSFQLLN